MTMKSLNKLLIAASVTTVSIGFLVLAGSGTALANGSGAGITGSPHDFSDDVVAGAPALANAEIGTGWNAREEICRVCHVPHDHALATDYYDAGLLWNHALSTATYNLYDSVSLEAAPGQPTGSAKLCLGCHDGSVALDTFDKFAGGAKVIGDYDAAFEVGDGAADLSGTHPLSVAYVAGAAEGMQPTTATMGPSGDTIADVLDTGNLVQCSSCHDVHDSPKAMAGTHLLREYQTAAQGGTASALCLTCHIK